MRLSMRLALAMVALVLLTVGGVSLLSYHNLEEAILPKALERVDGHARLLASDLETYARSAREDIRGFQSAVALQGIVRARLAGGVDPVDGASEELWRERMASRYLIELQSKKAYDQFRIIGKDGLEIVRVDRRGPGGSPRIAPTADLQSKADREFFRETIGLFPGDIHVSGIELTQNDGVIAQPHIPALRVASPIPASPTSGPGTDVFGIVVINVDMREAFDRLASFTPVGGRLFVVNEDGDYLVHPDPTEAFAFAVGRKARWQQDFPDFAAVFPKAGDAVRLTRDINGEPAAVALAYTRPAGGPRVGVLEVVPRTLIMEPITSLQQSLLLAAAVAVLIAALFAVLLARSFTKPLVQMTKAVAGFSSDRPIVVPSEAGGEIGVLARAFARMAHDVREKTSALNGEISQRRRMFDTLNNTITSMTDAVLVADGAGKIVHSNPAAERLMGIVSGQEPAEWVRPNEIRTSAGDEPIPLENRPLMRAVRGETVNNVELVVRHRGTDKTFDVVANGGPTKDAAGRITGAVVVYRDVTEAKAIESQLRQVQKMDAVGQLTGGVAHDFNNILTVITGTIDILSDAVSDRPGLAAVAKLIDEAASRGADLTNRLLAFARKQPLQPRSVDVNDHVIEVTRLLRATLGERIEIDAILGDKLPPALVDPGQLTTALINLALNARDAMPGGGKLLIETRVIDLDDTYAAAHAEVRSGRYVQLAVTDTGVGIPTAIRDRVFEPFFTTKEVGRGTGLGLSMVYGFVKQTGGHIKIYSEEGQGTTIKLYLPISLGDVEPRVLPEAYQGGSETILVVEDDDLVRAYVETQLRSLGYKVIPAANAAEALLLVDQKAGIDLLFTDVIMPGSMNGSQLAKETQRRRPGMRVLFTSGYTENAIVHQGRLDPGVLLLPKPYRKGDLARMIRQAVSAHESVA